MNANKAMLIWNGFDSGWGWPRTTAVARFLEAREGLWMAHTHTAHAHAIGDEVPAVLAEEPGSPDYYSVQQAHQLAGRVAGTCLSGLVNPGPDAVPYRIVEIAEAVEPGGINEHFPAGWDSVAVTMYRLQPA